MAHTSLESYYHNNFALMQHHKYSLTELDNLIPWEKEIYITLLSNHLEGYGTDVWTHEPPLANDKLYLSWLENQDKLEGRLIINPHTSYFSEEALNESRTKACLTCLDIINNRFINNRIV